MVKGVVVAVFCALGVCVFADEPKKPPEDIWKKEVKVKAQIKLSALFEDPHGQTDYNIYSRIKTDIFVEGKLGGDFKYRLRPAYKMDEPGKGKLVGSDMYVDYLGVSPLRIRAGKFKYPGSLGAFWSSGKMDFTTRPIMSSEVRLPQSRDIGIMFYGDALKRELGGRELKLRLYGSVTDGKEGAENEALMYTARMEFQLKGLFQFGTCYLKNHQHDEWIPTKMDAPYDYVNDLEYGSVDMTVFLKPCRFGGEFMSGRIEDGADAFDFEGYYVKAFVGLLKNVEAGVRYELWDRNRSEHYRTEVITVGVTFFFNPKEPHTAKLQLNWRKLREGDPAEGDENIFEVLLQIRF